MFPEGNLNFQLVHLARTQTPWKMVLPLEAERAYFIYYGTLSLIKVEYFFYPNLWNYLKNNLKIIDLDNSIHSQILLNNNLPMCVLRDC